MFLLTGRRTGYTHLQQRVTLSSPLVAAILNTSWSAVAAPALLLVVALLVTLAGAVAAALVDYATT
jgi:hypothetical protein